MNPIGGMDMPRDFKYRDVFLAGRPRHGRLDDFSLRHPKMEPGKRAKIFAPFDALRGFSFAIREKNVRYVDRPEPGREALRKLNRQLEYLYRRTRSSGQIREAPITLTATVFVPCEDPQNEAFGRQGSIQRITGICRGVDPELTGTLRLDEREIAFEDLLELSLSGEPAEAWE